MHSADGRHADTNHSRRGRTGRPTGSDGGGWAGRADRVADADLMDGTGARHAARRVMTACLGGFVLGVLACLVVHPPNAVSASHGLSYYGTTTATLPFYIVAMIAVAVAAWAASIAIVTPPWWRWVLRGISVGAPLVVITPFTLSTTINIVHDVFAGLVFFGQFLITAIAVRRRSWPVRLCGLVVGIGDGLAVHALFVPTADMLLAQLISLTGFLPLLTVWAWLPDLVRVPRAE